MEKEGVNSRVNYKHLITNNTDLVHSRVVVHFDQQAEKEKGTKAYTKKNKNSNNNNSKRT